MFENIILPNLGEGIDSAEISEIVVKDGDFVLSECEIFFPDLILLDWMLPNISGIELCRRLRTQKKYNKVRR